MRTATLTLLLLAWSGTMLAAAEPAALPGRLPPGVVPVHYEISLQPDAAALTFQGRVTIDVEVQRATDRIVLNAADLTIASARLDGAQDAAVTLDPVAQTAVFAFPAPLPTGRHRLEIGYTGRIFTTSNGLFAVDYATPAGQRRMLTTQFEVADGRRFAPMWDEPAAKATFTLEVVIPKEHSAYSNMPELSSQVVGDERRVRFDTSPKMSSYLLHLTVGELERISRKVGAVDVGVVTRKGAGESGRYALDAAAQVLPWFDAYFATPYPLPKLDMIAVPGSSQFFGAMENWGAIMYFEPVLLVDPRLSSEWDRQNVFYVVAHEIAHQWFGNLVTMDWWDDLWLNEGFATWMEGKTADSLHPQWNHPLQFVAGTRETAMKLDAGDATHPVVQPVPSVEAANQAFDAIAYSKGGAVIRMLEDAVGADGFREGMRRYMREYAYGNTVTDQLWGAIAAATGEPVMDIAHDFTLQPGVPLVEAAAGPCEAGRTTVTLRQGRYETGTPSDERLAWRIPVRLNSVGGGEPATVVLAKGGAAASVSVPGCGPVVVNAGQAGYFRTQYGPTDFARLRDEFARVADVDRLGILNDTWALGAAGRIPAASYLELASAVPDDADPLVLRQVATTFATIDQLLDGSREQGAWRRYARTTLRPMFDRVGWLPVAGESESVALLRERLIGTLGRLEDRGVIAEARRRFGRAEKDPGAMPAAIREAVIPVVARHADARTWNEIRARANAALEPIEKERLYTALGWTADTALARRALAFSLSDEMPEVFATNIVQAVAVGHPALAFDFAVNNEAAVLELVEGASRWAFIPSLAGSSDDLVLAARLKAYADRSVPADARQATEQAVAEIGARVRSKAKLLPALEEWVRGGST